MFRLGYCTSPTFGAVTVEMVPLYVAPDVDRGRRIFGGTSRSLSGAATIDRIAVKQTFKYAGKARTDAALYVPVLALHARRVGPFMLYDGAAPNLLPDTARGMSAWTGSTGTPYTPRADSTLVLASGQTAQIGPSTSPPRAALAPVVAGSSYWAGATVRGPGAWSAALTVAWYDNAGSAALSTSSLGSFNAAGALSAHVVLDGATTGYRVGGAATAPTGATYAQLRVALTGAAADLSDPTVTPGTVDPGRGWWVVDVDELAETAHTPNVSTLSLSCTEI